jgi:hypothetical protein
MGTLNLLARLPSAAPLAASDRTVSTSAGAKWDLFLPFLAQSSLLSLSVPMKR